MTQKELADKHVPCGALPLQDEAPGCGARDWAVFSTVLLNKAAGERLLRCRNCGAECLVRMV